MPMPGLRALATLNVVVLIVALVLAAQIVDLNSRVDALAAAVGEVRTGGAVTDGVTTLMPTGWDAVPSILSLQQRLDQRMDELQTEVQDLRTVTDRIGADSLAWNASGLDALRSLRASSAPATAAP